MTTLDNLIKQNKDFAAHGFVELPLIVKTIIVSCADPRVDPAQVLGLDPGEAVMVRNIGGRVTPGTLENLSMLIKVAQIVGVNPKSEFNLIVLQHTKCGINLLNEASPDMLTNYFVIGKEELKAKAVTDPRAAVAIDVAALRANPALPGWWLVSGLVYDVETGLVNVVVPPAPLRETGKIE
jgi:carbonic anhydrase